MALPALTRFLFLPLMICAALVVNIGAQVENPKNTDQIARASYEVRLQLLVSADSTAGNKLPNNFAAIEKKLREDFGQQNYQLALTLVNRTTENGLIEVKGVNRAERSQASIQTGEDSPTFYDFNLNGIKGSPTNADELLIDTLRFGLRVPLVRTTVQDGKSFSIVNYENIGITAKPVSVAFDQPTVIGTMTTSRPNELIILVLTVKTSGSVNRIAKKN